MFLLINLLIILNYLLNLMLPIIFVRVFHGFIIHHFIQLVHFLNVILNQIYIMVFIDQNYKQELDYR
jgi:hypothetical protein